MFNINLGTETGKLGNIPRSDWLPTIRDAPNPINLSSKLFNPPLSQAQTGEYILDLRYLDWREDRYPANTSNAPHCLHWQEFHGIPRIPQFSQPLDACETNNNFTSATSWFKLQKPICCEELMYNMYYKSLVRVGSACKRRPNAF